MKNPYLLLTPGPLSTSESVKQTMLRDWCTWDDDYNLGVVQPIRQQLVDMALETSQCETEYSTVLMQGSGTFAVESAIGSAVPADGKLLVLVNGAYGKRIAEIAEYLNIEVVCLSVAEHEWVSTDALSDLLNTDSNITHVAMVHCETTSGILNPIETYAPIVKAAGKVLLVDAMSSFGGIDIKVGDLGIDFLISSANKCIQGVPGFGFAIARREKIEETKGQARSLSLDMYAQWAAMENGGGKWRFTSPTHVVRAFYQAMEELSDEGGVEARFARYSENQRVLVEGMNRLGFRCLLPLEDQSPIITSFISPSEGSYDFNEFYAALKAKGFVIYPGKVTDVDTFRIGNIGEVYPDDIRRLILAVESCMTWRDQVA